MSVIKILPLISHCLHTSCCMAFFSHESGSLVVLLVDGWAEPGSGVHVAAGDNSPSAVEVTGLAWGCAAVDVAVIFIVKVVQYGRAVTHSDVM